MKVRHCALSLVGEPIMYPRINTLISELHARRISSFLVTNAQFPNRIQCSFYTFTFISANRSLLKKEKKRNKEMLGCEYDRHLNPDDVIIGYQKPIRYRYHFSGHQRGS